MLACCRLRLRQFKPESGFITGLVDWEKEAKPRAGLIDAEYGWKKGLLPKYYARTHFHRQLVMRRMVTELIRRDHCVVAGARAPALQTMMNRLVDFTKNGDTASRQHVAYFVQDPLMVDKAFDEYPRRFRDTHTSYTMVSKLKGARKRDGCTLYFVELKNRDLSDCHKGEDYTTGPERFFLPPRVVETERGVIRPPHVQMAFDRWASKFKSEEFHMWWKMRHAKLRFWGIRNVTHPSDVDPLWNEKDEEEWHGEMLAGSGDAAAYDLDEASETVEQERQPLS